MQEEAAQNKSMLLVSSKESGILRDALTKHKSTDRSFLTNKKSPESKHSPHANIYSPCFFDENNPEGIGSSDSRFAQTQRVVFDVLENSHNKAQAHELHLQAQKYSIETFQARQRPQEKQDQGTAKLKHNLMKTHHNNSHSIIESENRRNLEQNSFKISNKANQNSLQQLNNISSHKGSLKSHGGQSTSRKSNIFQPNQILVEEFSLKQHKIQEDAQKKLELSSKFAKK
ncbi:hypothetical protein FGO68_gene113 [Halteria grandinella]|uniref:Uncharacterized protein n=1 Tax=Halteria grandinella TaxID=5974 RepID=A0A8J8NZ05_HALGN|nr:hypothetical protein FGO68_gene113 [Halteria grandinella]